MKPTDEQQHAIDLAVRGDSIALIARAGTGKTSTLELIGRAKPNEQGHYVAFNKATAKEALSRFPPNVSSSTMNSVAYNHVARRYPTMRDRMEAPRQTSGRVGHELKLWDLQVGRKRMTTSMLGSLATQAVVAFCLSDSTEPGPEHVPRAIGLDYDPLIEAHLNRQLADHLAPYVRAYWADLQHPSGTLPFSHDAYLKIYELAAPRIGCDFLLVDEAQDLNPVMLSIVRQQSWPQTILVGDPDQQIYEWRGAVDALQALDTVHRAFLSQSFRFGPEIAHLANRCLAWLDAPPPVIGSPIIESMIERIPLPRTVLCRSNAQVLSSLLWALKEGRTGAVVGGVDDLARFTRAAEQLQAGQRAAHPQLMCFETWTEVVDYVREDRTGRDLRVMVDAVQEFGCTILLDALARAVDEDAADVVLSTAHKAKGRQWQTVALAADFPETEDLTDAEVRLIYVAVTRAQYVLDPYAVELFRDGRDPFGDSNQGEIDDGTINNGVALDGRSLGPARGDTQDALPLYRPG